MNIVRTIGNNIHCFQCIGRNTHTFSKMMVSIRPEELYTLKKNVYDIIWNKDGIKYRDIFLQSEKF